jgi:hypothetical protein
MTAFRNPRRLARLGRKRALLCLTAGGLCGPGLSGFAVANPPLSAGRGLDLQPPIVSMRMGTPGPVSFGSHPGLDWEEPTAHPRFGTRQADFPAMTQPEAWLHRVHREGVPIARLWSSKSAFLSIGFSPRGKPGLWLVQRIP